QPCSLGQQIFEFHRVSAAPSRRTRAPLCATLGVQDSLGTGARPRLLRAFTVDFNPPFCRGLISSSICRAETIRVCSKAPTESRSFLSPVTRKSALPACAIERRKLSAGSRDI